MFRRSPRIFIIKYTRKYTVVLEKTLESPWTARRSNQSWKKSTLNIHWKDWCWSWSSSTLATWCEELTHWKRPWCWERLKAGEEEDDREWDGWMASPTQWTQWISPSSGSWWWTGKPGMLHFMGSQRVRHDWGTELILENIISKVACLQYQQIYETVLVIVNTYWILSSVLRIYILLFNSLNNSITSNYE